MLSSSKALCALHCDGSREHAWTVKIQDPFLHEAQVFIWVFISLAFSEPRWDVNLAGAPAAMNSRSTRARADLVRMQLKFKIHPHM